MFDDAHRGAEAPGLFQARGDSRVQALTDLLLEHQALQRGDTRLFADPQRALNLQRHRLGSDTPLTCGLVAHALPHVNSYRVQMAYGGGVITCRLASEAACIPLGVRRGSPVPAGSRVLVWKDPADDVGTILAVLPHQLEDSRLAVPGYLVQGSGVGLKREDAHKSVLKMFRQGGVQDFSCQSPLDATSQEWSRVSETGTAVLLSAMEAVLKVNELCGLFLSYWDSHALLAAFNLDLSTAARECRHRHDEGEHRVDEHTALYPWEGVGIYDAGGGTDVAAEFADKDVQYGLHKGKVDLPDGKEDTQPFYRVQTYGGYVGQGGLTQVVVPPKPSGVRRMSDADKDIGVAADFTGLDGNRVIQSAKQVLLLKRAKMEIPREVKLPEDGSGDDATLDNYRFSGSFGSGAAHLVNDFAVPAAAGVPTSLTRVAGVQDVLARAVNWQRLHPFHYHSHDYQTWQESADAAVFARTQESLNFDALKTSGYLADPTPVAVNVDHRYNSVNYYLRESFLCLHDDGSVTLAGGGGERLAFVNGKIRVEAPGNVEVVAGCQALTLANEVILKAQGSVDISSSRQDLRLRAFHNLQIEGEDNVLIESKKADALQVYRDKVGEDVVAGGIVLKSRSAVGVLADEIYLRSGVGAAASGDIVLDAAKEDNDVVLNAAAVRCFATEGLEVWCAAAAGGAFTASHFFGLSCAHHHTALIVAEDLTVGVCDGDGAVLLVNGSANVTGNVGAAGQVASGSGGLLGVIAPGFAAQIRAVTVPQCQGVDAFTKAGGPAHDAVFADYWYVGQHLGDDATIGLVGFSYRDPDVAGKQYHTQNLVFEEPRWQQLVRAGGGAGGSLWAENPVSYQGRQLYPWPGRQKWLTDLTFAQSTPILYDWPNGYDRDRPANYETPTLPAPQLVTMASAFKVINQT